MGFDRTKVDKVLSDTHNNFERAIEILISERDLEDDLK